MIRSPLFPRITLSSRSIKRPFAVIAALGLLVAAGAVSPDRPAAAQTASTGTTQYWVQIGANPDEAASRAQWEKFRAQGGGVFDRAGNRIQRADLGPRGIFYRVQVGPFASAREAGQFCAQLKGRQIDCFLPPPEIVRAQPGDAARNAAPERPAPSAAAPTPAATAKPVEARPPEARPSEKPKPETASAPPKTAPAPMPAEKPKEPISAKKPDPLPETPSAKPETRPPSSANADKPDAPISTAPGLPGVLD